MKLTLIFMTIFLHGYSIIKAEEKIPILTKPKTCMFYSSQFEMENRNGVVVGAMDGNTRPKTAWFLVDGGTTLRLKRMKKKSTSDGVIHIEYHRPSSKIWVVLDCQSITGNKNDEIQQSKVYQFMCEGKLSNIIASEKLDYSKMWGTCNSPDIP